MILTRSTIVALLAALAGASANTSHRFSRQAFSLSSNVVFSLRGGSDSGSEDPSAPTIETSVIGSSEPTQADGGNTIQSYEAAAPEPVAEIITSPPAETAAAAQEKKTVNPKLANAIERTGPAVALLGAIYFLIKFTGENGLLYGLIPLMQLGMYTESTGIIEDFKKDVEVKFQKWWWFATVFTSTTLRYLGGIGPLVGAKMNLACFGMVSFGLVVSVVGMARHQSAGPDMFRKYLGELAAFHFALIFLIGQSSFWIKTIQTFGMEWVIYPALLVVVNDTMAYVFGMLMGKNKLLPRLSPKKTVEGFIGGGVSTCAIAVPLLKYFVNNVFADGGKAAAVIGGDSGDMNIVKHAIMLGLYTSFISPFGGFLASAVKRAHGAKDFGTLIPGHGGVVDRMDCQIVTAPFVFLYLTACLAK